MLKRWHSQLPSLLAGMAFAGTLMAWGVPSHAEPITFDFTGTVVGAGPFMAGDPVSGFFTFESTAPDFIGIDPAWGLYGVNTFYVQIGTYTASSGVPPLIEMEIRNSAGGDRFHIEGILNGPAIAGYTRSLIKLTLFDPTAIAFSTDSLPLVPPLLSAFSLKNFSLLMVGPAPLLPDLTFGSITSLTLREQAPIPEPATIGLMTTGLIGLVAGRLVSTKRKTQFQRP